MDKITHKVRCEQWTNIIKECLASGMPKTTWCREHHLRVEILGILCKCRKSQVIERSIIERICGFIS